MNGEPEVGQAFRKELGKHGLFGKHGVPRQHNL